MTTTVPTADDFAALVRPGVAIPVVRVLDVGGLDPLAAFRVLAEGEAHAALLETSEAGSGDADMSIVAPRARAVLGGADVLDRVRAACADEVVDIGMPLPRCVGGAIGMLGHEHVRTIEPRVPEAAGAHPAGAPDTAFLLVDTLVVFEHRAGRVLAIHTVVVPDDLDAFDARAAHAAAVAELDRVEAGLVVAAAAPGLDPVEVDGEVETFGGVHSNLQPGAYEAMVEAAREDVLGGECVQVVVSQRFDRAYTGDPLDAYRALRALSPAPYHVLLRLVGDAGPVHVVGASPEQLVGVLDGCVVTHPIAGTRPRGRDEEEDQRLERELLADPKERCEHTMLVDLGRNDVGRVATPGTVRVVRLCEVERFSHVMHLVSRVEGDLREGLHPVDALRSAFPAGTLTGAPKVRAMEIIARLEPDRRGPYGGAVGYVGHGRMLDMAITIRSAVLAGGMAYVQAGAGVVSASDPASEEAETRAKASSVLHALALAEAGASSRAPIAAAGQGVVA
ncbi:MAG: anthranilate synthase component [Thermoleophilia bacterium]|nr:anthranilate synthase component [Thermoleophilia bacterium]